MLGVGIGCFAAVQMLIEADLDPHEVKFSGGVTGEDILRVTTQIDDAVRLHPRACPRGAGLRAPHWSSWRRTETSAGNLRQGPRCATRASSFPTYLRMVESSLGGYRELHRLPVRTKDWETSLRNTEATTGTVVMAFRQLVVDLSDQKRTSLEVDTNTLRRLLGEAAQQYTASALPEPDAPSALAQTGANHESAATGRRGRSLPSSRSVWSHGPCSPRSESRTNSRKRWSWSKSFHSCRLQAKSEARRSAS